MRFEVFAIPKIRSTPATRRGVATTNRADRGLELVGDRAELITLDKRFLFIAKPLDPAERCAALRPACHR
jgi:hypothetical protein